MPTTSTEAYEMPEDRGLKYDDGKTPWHLMPWDALEAVAEVLAFGARKYAPRNWEKGIHHERLFAAAIRHLVAWHQQRREGESLPRDPESSLPILAHAACCVLFALALELRELREMQQFITRTTKEC